VALAGFFSDVLRGRRAPAWGSWWGMRDVDDALSGIMETVSRFARRALTGILTSRRVNVKPAWSIH